MKRIPFAREYLNIYNDVYTAKDFMNMLAEGLPTIYHVEDSIENYNLTEPVINKCFRSGSLNEACEVYAARRQHPMRCWRLP